MGLLILEKSSPKGMVCKYVNILWEGINRAKSDSFEWCLVMGWGNMYQLKNRRLCLKCRKHLLLWGWLKSEASCPGVLWVFILGDIQKLPACDPWKTALGDLIWAKALNKMTFRGTFQSHPFCNSVLLRIIQLHLYSGDRHTFC